MEKVGKITAPHFGNLHYFHYPRRYLSTPRTPHSAARFLKDPVNSILFEEPASDSDHKQEQEQEPAPRKRKPQPNKKAAKKTFNDEVSSECKKKKKDPEPVSTVMFTSSVSNYQLDCGRQDVIVEDCCYTHFFLSGTEAELSYFFGDLSLKTCGNVHISMLLKRLALSPGMFLVRS